MFYFYHRAARISVLLALAAAGALVVVGGIALTTLVVVGIIACGTRLLCAMGLISAEPPLASQDRDTTEGVVVSRSSSGLLDR